MKISRKEFFQKSLLGAMFLPEFFTQQDIDSYTSNFKTLNPSEKRTGFKISIFSKHLQWLDYPSMGKVAAEIGFDGVDLTVRPRGHVLPERVTDDLPKAVESIRKAGLEVYMITTAITDAGDKYTEPILRTASELGIKNYRLGWYPYDDTISIQENLDGYELKLKELADLNKELGIRGDYQNHSGSNFGAPVWDLWLVLNKINTQWIGCQYDIRHATVEGGRSWPLGLKLMSPFIGSLDIKDFHWSKKAGEWKAQNVPLAEGMVDFRKYFELLKKYVISVPISIHYEYPLGGAERGATSLRMDQKKVIGMFQRDLEIMSNWLKEAGLK